jgi:hypothetical protein
MLSCCYQHLLQSEMGVDSELSVAIGSGSGLCVTAKVVSTRR